MRRAWCLAAVLLAAWTGAASGVSLRARSATVARSGDVADLCVGLDSGGARVAATQNDLVWDGSCATLPSERSCRINPATGKDLSARIQGAFDIKLIVLSFSNVNPIPDGALYCCAFRVEADPGTCCPVAIRDALASDPAGNALATAGNSANLCVLANPFDPTPTPEGDSFGFGSGTGCQTAPPVATGMGAAALLPAALLLAARRLVSSWRAGRALRPRRRGR